MVGKGQSAGCLFVTLAQEYDDRPGSIRDLLVRSQEEWRLALARMWADAARPRGLTKAEAEQLAFELIGLALSFQLASKLLGDAKARAKARAGFARLVGASQPRSS
jgi:hypothetical protein